MVKMVKMKIPPKNRKNNFHSTFILPQDKYLVKGFFHHKRSFFTIERAQHAAPLHGRALLEIGT
jgi:hypothetical protein